MSPNGLWRIARTGLVSLVVIAAFAGLALGDRWLWMAARWSPYSSGGGDLDTANIVALLAIALVKGALLWLILRTPAPGPLNGRAKALRGLLYLAVAYTLVLRWGRSTWSSCSRARRGRGSS
ncbi:hypothetical protein GCM10009850_027900 [Nonomuraea monospora]|uniref:Uncharacterized protein n=1 Tax=Nonomuraea monospora TaxID=568818 RepID=A0ABP5P6H1_9ACTN